MQNCTQIKCRHKQGCKTETYTKKCRDRLRDSCLLLPKQKEINRVIRDIAKNTYL